ncbi:CDP photolyase [Lineolata rhizophorae]|uniref:CDP photolyase n=1 Tax=Lineolata rhizophorae TaxID=578093 RepID=A0A6A6NSH7_9PEZI|nr:CDP photolyase [Lineolata rhizophorae]
MHSQCLKSASRALNLLKSPQRLFTFTAESPTHPLPPFFTFQFQPFYSTPTPLVSTRAKIPPKRKAHNSADGTTANKRSAESTSKKNKTNNKPSDTNDAIASSSSTSPDAAAPQFDHSRVEERVGIVRREFYPPEMSNERCARYNADEIPRPIEELQRAISETHPARRRIEPGDAVVHWFKRDLRMSDNKGLFLAGDKAREAKVPLVCLFVVSPQDYEAHGTSAARVDFELRSLEVLKRDLAERDIPLYVETVEKRRGVPDRIVELCGEWGAKHVFCNIEYEVDELRRETLLTKKCLENGIDFTAVHDDVVVAPGRLSTGQGKQYAVYSPWYRSWVASIHENPDLLEEFEKPEKNPESAREKFKAIFDESIPKAPENKKLTREEEKRFEHLWPAGEHEAVARLDKFLNEKIGRYSDTRNYPAANSTAMVSVHHSAGTLAARTSVRMARNVNRTKKLDGGNQGIAGWISEVAWRDFYKHVLAHWPYVCMYKPFKYEYTNIEWEYNNDHFDAWCKGKTGFPIVDAAMRQLNHMGYMHNRCRMIVASFLSKDLLLDWRMGEKYFMEQLIDGDFASNNGGWGFSASTGVDPQPYFRIFNPLLQSEKFDPDGEYIRKWVVELRDVEGKAIHEPYGRGAEDIARKNGYPEPIVNHKECRDRALERYKVGLGRSTA